MKVAVELLISCSLSFQDEKDFKLSDPRGIFELTLKNNKDAGPFAKRSLVGVIVFEISDLSGARDQALDFFAIVQNALTFATGAVFSDVIATKAFDWEPGKLEREARFYATSEASLCHPALDQKFIGTTERLIAMHSDDASQSIMRWYRLGLASRIPEEQFSYFWFVVEIAAEKLKETGKVAPVCPICSEDLFCRTCGTVPQRRRFATEAIQDLISVVSPTGADQAELYKTLTKIRNTLQHGRRISSIAKKLPCTEEQAVNIIARIAWRAITLLADNDSDPSQQDPFYFVDLGDVQQKTMVMTASVLTQLLGNDHQNPRMENAPDIGLTQVIDAKNYTFDGKLID